MDGSLENPAGAGAEGARRMMRQISQAKGQGRTPQDCGCAFVFYGLLQNGEARDYFSAF